MRLLPISFLFFLSACVQNYVTSTVVLHDELIGSAELSIILSKLAQRAESQGAECTVSQAGTRLACPFYVVKGNLDTVGAGYARGGKYNGRFMIRVKSNKPTYLVVNDERIKNGYLPHKLHAEWEDWIFSEFDDYQPTNKFRSWRGIRINFE